LGVSLKHETPIFHFSDRQAMARTMGWTPKRSLEHLLEDIWRWLIDEWAQLEPILSI
jgi:hypothetical protein